MAATATARLRYCGSREALVKRMLEAARWCARASQEIKAWCGLVHGHGLRRRRRFHRGDAVLHRLLHLLEGAHFDLAHAFARDAELGGEVLERHRVLGEAARLEDAPLTIVEHGERVGERQPAVVGLLALGE